jgi:large subunit ribosomal protein L23
MRQEKLLNILLSPHVSEKAALQSDQYVFEVARTATKTDVKAAVEQLFQVSVKAVNIVRVKGASATKMGRSVGRQGSWKKAYVMLKPGQEISLA